MKKANMLVICLGLSALVVAGTLIAVEPVAQTSTSGIGKIHFGKDGDGLGYFEFDVDKQGVAVNGYLQFAAEHHEGYPEIVIQLDAVEQAKFSDNVARFSGKGKFHLDSVIVNAFVRDGAQAGELDYLQLNCTDGDGRTVFEVHGEVQAGDGDIVVGAPS
jgi:hypothetical protein